MKEKPSLTIVILNSLCALLWSGRCIRDLFHGSADGSDVLCAAVWCVCAGVWIYRYWTR